jgi:predicted amidohydrolase
MPALSVAAAQIECVPGDIAANLARHLATIEAARGSGAGLLVFPELSLTDYLAAPDLDALALSQVSREIAQLAAAARGIAVSFGFIERDDLGAFHNAQALVADGCIIQVHRKANLPSYGRLREGHHYRPGRAVHVASLAGDWRVATLIRRPLESRAALARGAAGRRTDARSGCLVAARSRGASTTPPDGTWRCATPR